LIHGFDEKRQIRTPETTYANTAPQTR